LLTELYHSYKRIDNGKKPRLTRTKLAAWELALNNLESEQRFYYLRTEYPSVLPFLQAALEFVMQYRKDYLGKTGGLKKQK
jgi:hypothetical protein